MRVILPVGSLLVPWLIDHSEPLFTKLRFRRILPIAVLRFSLSNSAISLASFEVLETVLTSSGSRVEQSEIISE